MNLRRFSALFALLAVVLSGCLSNKKTVILQNEDFHPDQWATYTNEPPVYKLQPNDVISINIKSLDDDLVDYLSLRPPGGMVMINEVANFVDGFSVSDSGFIFMPRIGKIYVLGLSVEQTRQKIQDRIRETQVGDVSVFVALVSFRISVTGEVGNPGQFYVYNNQVNLLEAISRAGGFTDFADRQSIKLIRQTKTGSVVKRLDFTDPNILNRPEYYLIPNDIIVVDNLEQKNQRGNLSTLVIVNTLVSTISATAAILTIINNRRQNDNGN